MPVNVPIEDSNGESELEELSAWIREHVQKLADDDPGTIIVTAKGEKGVAGDVVAQIDPSDANKSLEDLARVAYEAAERDAVGNGGGIYFVTLGGVPGRFPIVFEGGPPEQESSEEDGEGDEHGYRGGPPHHGGNGGRGGPMGRLQAPVPGWVEYAKLRDTHEKFLYEASIQERRDVHKLMQRMIIEQNETIRHYEKERSKERVMIDEILSTKHVRDMEITRAQKAEERKEDALGLLKPWAHAVGARLLGPKAIPKDVVPLLNQFEAVFSTFTPEQFSEFTTSGKIEFSSRQKQEFLGLFSTLMNLTEQAKKAKAQEHQQQQQQTANGQASSEAGKAE